MKLKKKQPKPQPSKPTEEEEEEYDFDFSIYEQEENKTEELQSLKKLNKPRITGLRSKFNISTEELESLLALKNRISQYGIKVASRTQDMSDLWGLYGCLDEYWARIHDIYGTVILTEVDTLKKMCYDKLIKADEENQIPYQVHELMLKLRNRIYIAAQRIGLGLEVEKTSFGHNEKAKKGIIE